MSKKDSHEYIIFVIAGGKEYFFKGKKETVEPYSMKLMRFELEGGDEPKTFKTLQAAENQALKCQEYLNDYYLKNTDIHPKAEIRQYIKNQGTLF